MSPGAAAAADNRPYDATGWTLPAQMGVDVRTIARLFDQPAMSRLTAATIAPAQVWADRRPTYYLVDARGNGGATAANRLLAAGLNPAWLTTAIDARGVGYGPGSIVIPAAKAAPAVLERIAAQLGLRVDGLTGKLPAATRPLPRSRIALYKSWIENSDEGWTRWLLEQYEFPFKSIADGDVRAGNLRGQFDVIVLPSETSASLRAGLSSDVVPPEYAGGLGEAGIAALKAFVMAGGTLVTLDQASAFAIDAFGLPVRDVAHGLPSDAFFCPGSILRVAVDPSQPLAYGMSADTAGFFGFSAAYELPPSSGLTAPAHYAEKNVLLSGWLTGERIVAGRAAVVEAHVGAGRIVLLGFPVQHRGQSYATFRLLFNALLTAAS
jgi:hypothetical protein